MNQHLQPSASAGALRILIVDDNEDAAEALSTFLKMMGHEVDVCHDGAQALAAWTVSRPDMILLDIGLPTMDGYEVARRIVERAGEARPFLVALTGYGQSEDRQRSREAGFAHHLVKPIAPLMLEQLLARARSALVASPQA